MAFVCLVFVAECVAVFPPPWLSLPHPGARGQATSRMSPNRMRNPYDTPKQFMCLLGLVYAVYTGFKLFHSPYAHSIAQAYFSIPGACSHNPPPLPPSCPPSLCQFQEQYTAAGLRFFVNPKTNAARWSPPKSRRRDAAAAVSGVGDGMDDSLSSTSKGGGRAAGLPRGWEKRTTPAGRAYYVNHDLRITQWAPPEAAVVGGGEQKLPYAGDNAATLRAASPTAPVVPTAAVAGLGGFVPPQPPSAPVFAGGATAAGVGELGLPGYIEVRTHADGRTYYVNHRTKVTSWVPPPREDW